jgi:very-short-patch-repair endonuclease
MIDDGGHVFDSTEEIEVAIILLQQGIKFRHQVRFGKRYVADFVLDEMKVVLEVDGDIFHGESTMAKQKIRDDLIVAALGPEWEIVRIKTSTLNQNMAKLPKALKAVLKKREMYRRINKGQLPEWYNDEG